MALAELGILASPQREIPPNDAGNLATIFKDLSDRFGENFAPSAILEYVKGNDDKGKKESKVLSKLTRELAPNEVLIVTFSPKTIAGTTNAFIYAVPENADAKPTELVGAMNIEQPKPPQLL